MANKFIIEIRTKGFNKATGDLDNLKKKTDQYGNASRKMRLNTAGLRREIGKLRNNLLLLTFAFGAVAVAINKTIAAYRTQVEAETRLRASLRNVASASADGADKLIQLAAALQQTTTFGDEQIISGMAMLATFQLNEDAIAALTPRMLDMAAAMGTGGEGLTTIALQVGKAFAGQIGSLSKSGVLIGQVALAASRATGPYREFSFLTGELDKNFKDLAAALALTDLGKIDQLRNEISDLNEELGKVSLPVQVFALEMKESIIKSLSWMILFHEEIKKAGGGMQLLEKIPGIIKKVNKAFEELKIEMPEFDKPRMPKNLLKDIELLQQKYTLIKLIGSEMEDQFVRQSPMFTSVRANMEVEAQQIAVKHSLLRKEMELNAESAEMNAIFTAMENHGVDLTIKEITKYIALQIKQAEVEQAINTAQLKYKTDTMRNISQIIGINKKNALIAGRIAQAAAIIDTYSAANKAFREWGGYPLGIAPMLASITAGLANVLKIESQLSSISGAARGADFVTSGPQMIMVGENPGGLERVQVTPLSSPNINGPQGGSITINISGGIIQEDYITNELLPAINKAKALA